MITNPELHRIRTGEASVDEARIAIRKLMADAPTQVDALYDALRGWTWKAMQMRRFDPELEDWYSLIKSASVAVKRSDVTRAAFVEALAHLVHDSIRYGETHTREQLVGRSHLGELLERIQRNNGRIERERLAADTGLSSSRLSQLLGELVVTGLVERQADGRRAIFVLSDSGLQFLDLWRAARRALPVPAEESEEAEFPTFMPPSPKVARDADAAPFRPMLAGTKSYDSEDDDARAGGRAKAWAASPDDDFQPPAGWRPLSKSAGDEEEEDEPIGRAKSFLTMPRELAHAD